MDSFVAKHAEKITGVLSSFDRIVFKGHLSINWPSSLEAFFDQRGLLLKDFKRFAPEQADRIKAHAQATAERQGRPYRYLQRRVRKEDVVNRIAENDNITEGLICVLAAVEPCSSFRLAYGKQRPRLVGAQRKCLCIYFYYQDRAFGRMYVRIQTWMPFMIQVYVNGHDWLAKKLDKHGIDYTRSDNVFLELGDVARAQRFANRFAKQNWPRILDAFARRVNPLLADLLADETYYWVAEQAEYATDVMFESPQALKDLYPTLLKHATHAFSAEDVLTFLGKKLHGNFKGEVLNDYKVRRPGARIKHRVKKNWIKMYDKQGRVLRVETVINHPYDFRVRRKGRRAGQEVIGWYPMPKGVANLPRYAEVCLTANRRYLEALAVVDDPQLALTQLKALAKPVRHNGRSYRGFNPASTDDLALFAVVLRGEHTVNGFRNRDVRTRLLPAMPRSKADLIHAARVSRSLKRLHTHRLIAKIPRSRRWRVTQRGHALMAAALHVFHETLPQHLKPQAL